MKHTTIKNHELVVAAFGKWPSFHDAEVVWLHLERDAGREFTLPTLTVSLYAFRLEVPPGDPARNESMVTIRFDDVQDLALADFNHQNAINGILMEATHLEALKCEGVTVRFLQGFGVSCAFTCRGIEVLSVVPIRRGAGSPDARLPAE